MTRMDEHTPGHVHPMTQVIRDATHLLADLGFAVAYGPEIETEYYNFDALNIPPNHPARDMWDTFWLEPTHLRKLLRTHTSPMQVRYMETHEPPLRVIVPGKVFRNEATDATHEAQFYQLEGLAIGPDITLGHLKGTLETFFTRFFGTDTPVRFRPSFFPFVEPGVEVDVACVKCSGSGCGLCKHSGWIEMLGGGMVHPNVLAAAGIHPRRQQGFAFGFGLDRFALLRYGIDDMRLLYTGDLRLVHQF